MKNRLSANNVFQRHRKKTLVAVVLVALVAIDLAAGAAVNLWRARLDRINRSYRTSSPFFHHGLAANCEVKNASWGGHRYPLATNSLGFRDSRRREVPLSSDRYRIVFIGDSFTEGVGVDYEHSFVGRVAGTLAARDVDVLNAAATSYSPAIYLAKTRYLIEQEGLEFDELVVMLDVSDAEDDVRYQPDSSRLVADYAPSTEAAAPLTAIGQVKHFIYANTVLTFYVLNRLKKAALGISDQDERVAHATHDWRSRWTIDTEAFDAYGRKGLERMTSNMDDLAALLEKHQVRLTVAVYPWPDQILHHDLDSIQVRHWQSWAEKHGAVLVNLFPRFINQRPAAEVIEEYYIPHDTHWNEAGHLLAATALLEYFSDETWEKGTTRGLPR